MINRVKCLFQIMKNHSINITTIDIGPVIRSFKESSYSNNNNKKFYWKLENNYLHYFPSRK